MQEYIDKLHQQTRKVAECPVSLGRAEEITVYAKAIKALEHLQAGAYHHDCDGISPDEAKRWAEQMQNADGSVGAHWTTAQTDAVVEERGVSPVDVLRWAWSVTMNMMCSMYSDDYAVAAEFGVDRPEFYAALAQAFLIDKDAPAPEEKLCEYYKHIASRS